MIIDFIYIDNISNCVLFNKIDDFITHYTFPAARSDAIDLNSPIYL